MFFPAETIWRLALEKLLSFTGLGFTVSSAAYVAMRQR
ncbi:hypothetical protein TCARB_1365 [Thermofilum adornatum 1505]|uniref:Uncharacterized protein n=1 Tax=Thermofilum adornatum 1505 TaxID=697581 RepID=A0A3G1A9M2_9CREN|nr:hypothetical protein TCARB_1365 [Thermofilum adornatum 1505]